MAEWIARALRSSGYEADFSPRSLWEIDRFFDENTADGAAIPGGLLATSGPRVFALGGYIGEVIRRSVGGTWRAENDDPLGEINVELLLVDTSVVWPVQRAMKRFRDPSDGIGAYGLALGVPVGARPRAQR